VESTVAEIHGIAAELGGSVVGTSTLAGGFSHETCLLTLTDRQVVVRLGGAAPAVEAAVMAVARPYVPVPQVLLVTPPRTAGARPAMVLEYVTGTLLSQVLSHDEASLGDLGAAVGRAVARIGAVTFQRRGFFADEHLSVHEERPWSRQRAGSTWDVSWTCSPSVTWSPAPPGTPSRTRRRSGYAGCWWKTSGEPSPAARVPGFFGHSGKKECGLFR
jgi:aminoglycoside phosphotransferase (APT) family kinase protein